MTIRIITSVGLGLLVFITPWFVAVAVAAFLLLRFGWYELLWLGILIDTLSYPVTGQLLGNNFVVTSVFLILALVHLWLQPRLLIST